MKNTSNLFLNLNSSSDTTYSQPPCASIATTRSNIKNRFLIRNNSTTSKEVIDLSEPELGASIATTRSNIKN